MLDRPRLILGAVFLLCVAALFCGLRFELDASGESLILENDDSLRYYRQVRRAYGADDFLVIAFTPSGDILSAEALGVLRRIRDRILALESVRSVRSILDAPVVYHSGTRLAALGGDLKTLDSGDVGLELARREFRNNPFYRSQLLSADGRTTGMQVVFHPDEAFYRLNTQRTTLLDRRGEGALSPLERRELASLEEAIHTQNRLTLERREGDIEHIRRIMDQEREHGSLYLGGIPMIVADMLRFIRHDLVIFGSAVLVFLLLILGAFFRRARWVLLPLACCTATGVLLVGFLGLAGWSVTVISSNFLSILLIMTLSLTIHLIVRFRDIQFADPGMEHHQLITTTMTSMALPCFYTVLTTAVAFASLIVSDIRPVIDFGWIMVIGLAMALMVSFAVFPAGLALLPPAAAPPSRDRLRNFMLGAAGAVQRAPWAITLAALALMAAAALGIPRLEVENRFIDNFKSTTEIHQGMKVIDRQLGGTTPLEVIIDADDTWLRTQQDLAQHDELDEWLFQDEESGSSEPSYWLTLDSIARVHAVDRYLESHATTGKVLSIGTVVGIAEHLNGAPLDAFELALLRKRVPPEVTSDLIDPYLSDDGNQARFMVRVIESDPSLKRQELLTDIRGFLMDEMEFDEAQVHLTGMLVLYNNMLQSLYRSQILTIGAVFAAILVTFVILFRSLSLAAIAIVPNAFAAVLVLGIMGWGGIPLDMMTITIAAITIGIAVDDTIHYIHRLKREYREGAGYADAVRRCHAGVGKAMFHTSMAIIFGFAILAFSNFIPTIYFGLLTGFAMLVALLGDLVLLPALVLLVKPKLAA